MGHSRYIGSTQNCNSSTGEQGKLPLTAIKYLLM